MNYSLKTPLSCFLALSATAAMAAGGTENSLATLGEPLAVQTALPSVHVDVSGQQKKLSERVSLEGFWPFMQQEEQLLFLQGGWLRQQQRNLLSAGLGWRYFPEIDWGVGSNLFYDQDITRKHGRVGVGAEAWWQSLTLSANGYLPASSWRTAPDLKGYRERPAKGYDLTLKGYLPTLPHLGASVRYAHYLGDEVALGGSQQRQKSPKQWRWGIDVTPIPLLTVGYHQQPGFKGDAKHQITAALTYRFALPLSQQLDPTQVATFHSAQGQRLARVQREQLMALEYSKIAEPKPPKGVPKPTKPKIAPKPKALTLQEVTEYKEKIKKAMEELAIDKFVSVEAVNGLWKYLADPGGLKDLLETTTANKDAWQNVIDKKLEDTGGSKIVSESLATLISAYDTGSSKISALNTTNQEAARRLRDGLLKIQQLSDQYSAHDKSFEKWKALETAWTDMEDKSANLEKARQAASEKLTADRETELKKLEPLSKALTESKNILDDLKSKLSK